MNYHQVVILWRVKGNNVKYTWFENGWCGTKDVTRLTYLLNDIQDGDIELEMNIVISDLRNEHTKVRNTIISIYIPFQLSVCNTFTIEK